MTPKIEAAANIVVIVVAVVVGPFSSRIGCLLLPHNRKRLKPGISCRTRMVGIGARMNKHWYWASGKGATSAKTARLFARGSWRSNSKEGQSPLFWRSFPTPPIRRRRLPSRRD
jgi:hypothetical protein